MMCAYDTKSNTATPPPPSQVNVGTSLSEVAPKATGSTECSFSSTNLTSASAAATATATTTTTNPDSLKFTLHNYYYTEEEDAESIVSEDETGSLSSIGESAGATSDCARNYYYPASSEAHSKSVPTIPSLHYSDLKALMPGLFKNQDCHYVLSHFFSNELFFANNLCNLRENFLNYDFASFEQHKVLCPIGTLDPALNDTVLKKLEAFSAQADKLTNIITNFNGKVIDIIDRINSTFKTDKSLQILVVAKNEFNSVIIQYLSGSDGLNGVIDEIIDMLYDYNLVIQNNQCGKTPDEAFAKKTNDHYTHIESTLKVSAQIANKDVTLFKNMLESQFIRNKDFHELVETLRYMIDV